jgi:hypothetical protein
MRGALTFIWVAALVLLVFSFTALIALIFARIKRECDDRADPGKRERVSKALLHFALTGEAGQALPMSNQIERRILIETALDTVQILRGAPKQRLVQLLRDIGLDRRLQRQAKGGKLRDRLMALEALRLFPSAKTFAALHYAEQSRDLRIWLFALRTRTAQGAGPDMLGLLALAARPGAARTQQMQDLVAARACENLEEAVRALDVNLPTPIRALLVRALGETKRIEALRPLRVALYHPEGQVRSAAAIALGALGFSVAAGLLIRALRDPDWRVRLKAIEAISKLKLWRCAPAIEPLLEDRVWWVRFRAEEALRGLGDIGIEQLRGVRVALVAESGALARSAQK